MTPDEFRQDVLPRIVASWSQTCFCANPGFRKLLSFDFRDYDIGPTGLADSEILIDELIRKRFIQTSDSESRPSHIIQAYQCPQCRATCRVMIEEFSISMYRSTVAFNGHPSRDGEGLYLVGFYGFKRDDFEMIHDFRRAESIEPFTQHIAMR